MRCRSACLVVLALAGGVCERGFAGDPQAAAEAASRARIELDSDDVLEAINRATRRVAAAVEPSVVHISIVGKRVRGRAGLGQGSGWVYDDAGHVVTNAHVADGAPAILVQFQDGRSAAASLVGLDAATDIAVLKVDGVENVFPARRATGQAAQQGDLVYSFGSPFGFKFSMSQGVVSGLGRDPGTFSLDGYTNFIQSDAAVNPGNSGGPLVDVRGRVVGMNVAIATGAGPAADESTGQSAGISFAIPLSTIEPVVEQLIASGTVSKGFLGVNMPLTDEENLDQLRGIKFHNPGRGGVVVQGLVEGGPAAVAGLEEGDVIVGLGEVEVSSVAQLRSLIATTRPGQAVVLRVVRERGAATLSADLVNLDAARLNMARSALERFGIGGLGEAGGDEGGGVRAATVARGSPAEVAGLRAGARITKVRGIETASVRDLLETLVAINYGGGTRASITFVDSDGVEREAALTGRGTAAGN